MKVAAGVAGWVSWRSRAQHQAHKITQPGHTCVDGSMTRGARVALRMTTAFCIDSTSPGSPSVFHLSISLSDDMNRHRSYSCGGTHTQKQCTHIYIHVSAHHFGVSSLAACFCRVPACSLDKLHHSPLFASPSTHSLLVPQRPVKYNTPQRP